MRLIEKMVRMSRARNGRKEIPRCYLCGATGSLLHGEAEDWLFGAEGRWNFLECPGCGLTWLSPRPTGRDMARAYRHYFTHEQGQGRTLRFPGMQERVQRAILSAHFSYRGLARTEGERDTGHVLGRIAALRDYAGTKVMFTGSAAGSTLLDVGSGEGRFLARMRGLGWKVQGVESDGRAVEVARRNHGLEVVEADIAEANLPEGAFDVVTLRHVLEHVPDPVALLTGVHRTLRPGGLLVLLTPNVDSLGHRLLGEGWRGLEPPRHLYLFSKRTLATSVQRAGFSIQTLRAISQGAPAIWAESRIHRRPPDASPLAQDNVILVQKLLFYLLEAGLSLVKEDIGEELLLIATKEA